MKKHDKINSFDPEVNIRKNTLLSFERLHMKDLLFMLYDVTAVTAAYHRRRWFYRKRTLQTDCQAQSEATDRLRYL